MLEGFDVLSAQLMVCVFYLTSLPTWMQFAMVAMGAPASCVVPNTCHKAEVSHSLQQPGALADPGLFCDIVMQQFCT